MLMKDKYGTTVRVLTAGKRRGALAHVCAPSAHADVGDGRDRGGTSFRAK